MNSKASARLKAALPLALSAVFLGLIAYHFDGWSALANLDVRWLALGLAIAVVVDIVLGGFKWWFVIRSSGVDASFRECLGLWTGLMPATFFTPFQSGHLLFAVALGRAKGLRPLRALEIAGYDKWSTLHGTFVLLLIGQLLLPAGHAFAHPLLAAGAAAAVAAYFFDHWLIRLLGRWPRFREASGFLDNPLTLSQKLRILGLATVYQSSDAISMLIAVQALGAHVDPLVVFGAFPLVLLVSYVPITFSGFGVREPTVAAIFTASLTFDQAIACGLIVDLVEYVWIALFGVVALPYFIRVMVRGSESESGFPSDDVHDKVSP